MRRQMWCVLALLLLVSAAGHVQADPAFRTMPVLPIGDRAVYDAAPYAVLEPASGATATYDGFLASLTQGKKNIQLNQTMIQAGAQGHPYWMALVVRNTGEASHWHLDFGSMADGRQSLLKGIFIFDHLTREMVVDTFPKNDGASTPIKLGARVPISFARGQERLLIAYVVPASGQAFTHPLQFRPADEGANGVSQVDHSALFAMAALLASGVALSVLMQGMWAQGVGTLLLFGGAYSLSTVVDRILVGGLTEWVMTIGGRAAIAAGLLLLAIGLAGPVRTNIRQLAVMAAGILSFGVLCAVLAGVGGDNSLVAGILFGLMIVTGPVAALFLWVTRPHRGHRISDQIVTAIFAVGVLAAVAESMAGPLGYASVAALCLMGSVVLIGVLLGVFLMVRQSRVADRLAHHRTLSSERLEALNALKSAKDSSDYTNLLKVIEHERKLLIAAREREAQRIEEMRLAKVAADDANAAKSAFLAVISHEIRTPMTGVMGMVRLLQDTSLNNEQIDYARTILESGNAMMALLNDILDFEKIESGRLQLEQVTFDVRRLLQGVLNLMQGQASQKNIGLRTEIEDEVPIYVQGDPARLRQVLLNLVGNAIKFTNKGGVVVHLRVSPSDQRGPRGETVHDMYFAVQDTGIGIARGAERNIFTPFSQADASISRKFGGTGLGLAICKRLIEAMGSTINISSKEGEGTTFFFSLRMLEGHPEGGTMVDAGGVSISDKTPGTGTAPQNILRLLIVDDNEINRRVIAGLIDRKGHLSAMAESAEEAIEKIKETAFDGVFMDIQLSGMNGMEATRDIRQLPDLRAATTPIVALTGNVTDDDIKACFEAGMNDFIAKPINTDQFDQVLIRLQTGDFANAIKGMPPREPALNAQEAEILRASTPSRRAQRSEAPPITSAPSPTISESDPPRGIPDPQVSIRPAAPSASPVPPSADEDDPALPAVLRYAKKLEQEANAAVMGIQQETTHTFDDLDSFVIANEHADNESAQSETAPPIFDEQMVGTLKAALSAKDLEELVNGFLAKAEEILATLDTAISHGLIDTVRDKSHEMKGMAGNFGMLAVSRTASVIEQSLRTDNIAAVDKIALGSLIKTLRSDYQTARTAIEEWMNR